MAKPMPATKAIVNGWPSAQPIASTTAIVPATCVVPMPKIASGADTSFSPQGPIAMPAARKPSTEPRPRRLNTGTAMTPAAR